MVADRPAIGHPIEVAGELAGRRPGLLGALTGMADPRKRPGVRHRLAVDFRLALCAVVAGALVSLRSRNGPPMQASTLCMLGRIGTAPFQVSI